MTELSLDRVAVIGAGKMGITMIQALLERTNLEPHQIVATRKHAPPLDELAKTRASDHDGQPRGRQGRRCDPAVRQTPDHRRGARGDRTRLDESQMVVSIAAGVTSAHMDELVPGQIPDGPRHAQHPQPRSVPA